MSAALAPVLAEDWEGYALLERLRPSRFEEMDRPAAPAVVLGYEAGLVRATPAVDAETMATERAERLARAAAIEWDMDARATDEHNAKLADLLRASGDESTAETVGNCGRVLTASRVERMGDAGLPVLDWVYHAAHDCAQPKLCQRAARDAGTRMVREYLDLIVDHIKRGGRVQFGTFTLHNVPAGKLDEARRKFNGWYERVACPAPETCKHKGDPKHDQHHRKYHPGDRRRFRELKSWMGETYERMPEARRLETARRLLAEVTTDRIAELDGRRAACWAALNAARAQGAPKDALADLRRAHEKALVGLNALRSEFEESPSPEVSRARRRVEKREAAFEKAREDIERDKAVAWKAERRAHRRERLVERVLLKAREIERMAERCDELRAPDRAVELRADAKRWRERAQRSIRVAKTYRDEARPRRERVAKRLRVPVLWDAWHEETTINEDRGDFHLHAHVLILVAKGADADWTAWNRDWHRLTGATQTRFDEVVPETFGRADLKRNEPETKASLVKTLRYLAKVPGGAHIGQGTDSPYLSDWPQELFDEWWESVRGDKLLHVGGPLMDREVDWDEAVAEDEEDAREPVPTDAKVEIERVGVGSYRARLIEYEGVEVQGPWVDVRPERRAVTLNRGNKVGDGGEWRQALAALAGGGPP